MYDLLFYFTITLCILVAFLVAWTFYTGRKLYSAILKVFFFIFLVSGIGLSQEEEDYLGVEITVIEEKPLVFPKEMPKAIAIIDNETGEIVDYLSQEDAWRLMAYEFLYGNNSTKKSPLGPKNIII